MVNLSPQLVGTHILKFSREIASFPFLCVEKTEGDTVLTWRAWHVVAYLYFWWNYS